VSLPDYLLAGTVSFKYPGALTSNVLWQIPFAFVLDSLVITLLVDGPD